jgi:hypothetical protein
MIQGIKKDRSPTLPTVDDHNDFHPGWKQKRKAPGRGGQSAGRTARLCEKSLYSRTSGTQD